MDWVKSVIGLAKEAQTCSAHFDATLYAIAGMTILVLVLSVYFWDKVLPSKTVAA